MATLGLVWLVLFLALAIGGRASLQRRRTGDWGLRRPSGPGRWKSQLAGALSIAGAAAMAATAAAVRAGALAPLAALDAPGWRIAGGALMAAGTVLTLAAQLQMADAWRIGVRDGEVTRLVTGGLFRRVRNPIYSGIGLFGLGFALAVGSPWCLAALALAWAGIEIQVRALEEPYLLRLHGDAFRRYAAQVGRFVPGLGRR